MNPQGQIRAISSEKFRVAIDASGCHYQGLEAVNGFIINLATTIKVKIRSLSLLEIENLEKDQPPGILASALYLESSMTLHACPEREEVSLDIFLYRETDAALVVNALRAFYHPTRMNVDIRRNIEIA